jgi:5-methylcytosine-specific restriction endonuclease McrA
MTYIIYKKNEPENKDGRKKLPSALRRALWESKFGKETTKGSCFVCTTDIYIHDFHCGHKLASKNGGSDNITNLECVCSHCNLSMGTEDMMIFKNKYF